MIVSYCVLQELPECMESIVLFKSYYCIVDSFLPGFFFLLFVGSIEGGDHAFEVLKDKGI